MIASLSLGSLLWALVVIFFMVTYFSMLFSVVADVFRSPDLSGVKKALWLLALLIFPVITMVVYLVSRGEAMTKRSVQQTQQAEAAFADYVRGVAAPGGGVASELEKAKALLDSGAITDAEYAALKARLLG